jgi:uncharacterized protein YjbI with pentapeptide repeats
MDDSARTALDTETPVNPYSLLDSVNRSSRAANRAWLAFLVLLGYLAVTLAGVTHRDLLLNADISLPLLQAEIGLARFFLWVPAVLLLAHVGILLQLVMLARRVLEFDLSLLLLESTDRRTHPLRLELDNFFLVQALAGPDRSRAVSAFLNATSWVTLLILPLLLLLHMQVAFLPFHDADITQAHCLAVLADVVMLVALGVFLLHRETTYFGALVRAVAHNPGSVAFAMLLLCAAAAFSLFVATVPDARDGRSALFAAPDGAIFGILPRNLAVTDGLVLAGRSLTPGRPSISLRGRDLRNARLDDIDLRQADLRGANLNGASLAGADLRNAWLGCVGAPDKVQNLARGLCTSARAADFLRARLDAAKLAGIDLQGARLDEAQLEGADLSRAILSGATFARARLARALLHGAAMQGAGLAQANLQGADFAGARLQLADFTAAKLQAANLTGATLDGAMFKQADLDGADLRTARLYGADFSEAKLGGADLSGALVWLTTPPARDGAELAQAAGMVVKAPNDDEAGLLKAAVATLDAASFKNRLDVRIKPLTDAAAGSTWLAEPDAAAWQRLINDEASASDTYKIRLSELLAGLMCRAQFADGAVAAGLARRAASPGFRGDAAMLHARLKGGDCPAAGAGTAGALRELAIAAQSAGPR